MESKGIRLYERWSDIVDVYLGELLVGTVVYNTSRQRWYFWLGESGRDGVCSEHFHGRDEAVAMLIDRKEAWLEGIADAAAEGLRVYRDARATAAAS